MKSCYTIHLAKEPFKFSCSHFTILSAQHFERLHGHNYQVRVALRVEKIHADLGLAFDFNAIKPRIRMVCEELDERILLPDQSKYVQLTQKGRQLLVQFGGKDYQFPQDDCIRLPLVNISSEELARYFCQRLRAQLECLPEWSAIRVNVEETRGQSVSYQEWR